MLKKFLLSTLPLLSITTTITFSCQKPGKKISSTQEGKMVTRVLTEKLSQPWEILWGPDNFIWMTERTGRISRVDPATGGVTPLIVEEEVTSRGEGGLLGMALHPHFDTDPYVFVSYNYESGNAYKEKVVRYTYANNSLTDKVTIIDDIEASNIHNGSRLLMSSDLKLFITTGDASNTSLSQNINSKNGKVLRLNLDGSVPSDNPINNNPLWSSGHRNAQGLVFVNDKLFSSEHGPDTDDEINVIEKGGNYGWPQVRGTCDDDEQNFCAEHNIHQPLIAWTPTIATCGLDYYNSDVIPEWKNSLLLCTLKGSALYQLQLDSNAESIISTSQFFASKFGRLRDVCISPEGKVYICTSNGNNDVIIEITKQPA
jgi:glucose/arabinose dehydrogenase